MKRLFNAWIAFFSIIVLVACFFVWFLGTNHGAQTSITRIARTIPAQVQLGSIEGKLAGGLEIKNIHIKSESWDISAQSLYVRWNPFHLLGSWIGMKEVIVEGVTVNDLYPEVRNPHDLTWPRAKGIFSWIKARIRLFRVNGFIFQEAGRETLKVERVQAQLIWYLGGLNVRLFQAKGTQGRVEGSIGASFTRPKFTVNLHAKTAKSIYRIDGFRIRVNLEPFQGNQQIAGPITIIGMSGNNEQVKLSGLAGISKDSIYVDKVEIKEMGRPGIIQGNASLNVSLPERPYEINVALNDVNVSSKDQTPALSISGTIMTKGNITGYEGSFDGKNNTKSWQEVSLEGKFSGNLHEIKVNDFKGSMLNGVFDGTARVSWERGIKLTGALEVRNLNPAVITPDWQGTINADLITELTFSVSGYPEGKVRANLLRSLVRKRPLLGNIDAHWKNGAFTLTNCELRGNGFDISARGALQEQIDYQVRITDLGGLIPEAGGRFLASGWVRQIKDEWAGETKAEGSSLRVNRFKSDSVLFQAQVNERGEETVKGRLQARNATFGALNLGSPVMSVEGKISSHDLFISLVWPNSSGSIVGHGGYREGLWQGTVSRIEGKDFYSGPFSLAKPIALILSDKRINLSPLTLTGSAGESLEVAGDLTLDPMRGDFNVKWEKLNLARINQFLQSIKFDGQSSGSLDGQVGDKDRLKMNGTGFSMFTMTRGSVVLRVSSSARLICDEKGMRVSTQAGFKGGGKLEALFESNEPAYFKKPQSGNIKITWNDLDMAIIKSWLPQGIDLKGKVSGAVQGKLLADSRFELSGDSRMTGSSFSWSNEGGTITTSAENGSVDFYWRDQRISGNLDVRFPSHGNIKGSFAMPVVARFPLEIQKTGTVDIAVNGEIRERGIVSSLFPGLIEESKGQLSFEVKRTGTWELADVKGRMRLENAAAYLPATGARIKDGTMDAMFVQDRIELTSFSAKSGPGKIEGSGIFWLKNFGIDRYRVKIGGEGFQAIYLPELQVQTTPDLVIEGEGNKVKIRGAVRIPEALLRDDGSKTSVRTSQDVIILDAPQKTKKTSQTISDIQVNVLLGEKVRVQVQGLDGRMEGSVLLTGVTPDKIRGKGTMRIVNGKYNSYGIKLDVTRGYIIFDNEPVEQASLDIMAIRTFNPGKFEEIKAGVTVTGTPVSPLVKLYSEPPMTDTDILSYMVIGRPIKAGAESNQTAMLLKSASAILGGTKASGIQNQLQQRLGIDTIDMQEGPKSSFTSSRTTASSSSTIDNSLMTVGKYLSPDLYVSYGRSLFNEQFLVSARYTLSKQLEIESKAGIATSVDLYYKIDFD